MCGRVCCRQARPNGETTSGPLSECGSNTILCLFHQNRSRTHRGRRTALLGAPPSSVAIDRFTGQVIDKQIEVVNE